MNKLNSDPLGEIASFADLWDLKMMTTVSKDIYEACRFRIESFENANLKSPRYAILGQFIPIESFKNRENAHFVRALDEYNFEYIREALRLHAVWFPDFVAKSIVADSRFYMRLANETKKFVVEFLTAVKKRDRFRLICEILYKAVRSDNIDFTIYFLTGITCGDDSSPEDIYQDYALKNIVELAEDKNGKVWKWLQARNIDIIPYKKIWCPFTALNGV
jgi:hypothetical protein